MPKSDAQPALRRRNEAGWVTPLASEVRPCAPGSMWRRRLNEGTCSRPRGCVTDRNVTRRNEKNPGSLTDLQQAILQVIWRQGTATAEQVREALLPRYPLKDSSIRTLLRRLEERGYVSHLTEGKVFVYKAEVGSHRVAARTVQHLIDRFCHGSAEQFLMGMVDEKVLTLTELQRLVRKVEKRK